MHIITLANQKGGPGKTTTSMLIGCEFHNRGRSVIVVDADPQGSAQKWETRYVENYPHIPFPVEHLVGLNEKQFAAALSKRIGGAEIVIIDTPPRLDSLELFAAIYVADLVVIPFVPDAAHADALEEVVPLFNKVNDARAKNSSSHITVRLLINRHDPRRPGEKAIASHASEIAGFVRLDTTLGNRSAFQNAWNYRTTLNAVANSSTPARKELFNLVNEIEVILYDKESN